MCSKVRSKYIVVKGHTRRRRRTCGSERGRGETHEKCRIKNNHERTKKKKEKKRKEERGIKNNNE